MANKDNIDASKEERNSKQKKSFFKDVLKSIKDFDKYEDFVLDGMGRNSGYLIKITAIFTLVIAIVSMYKFSKILNTTVTYFNDNVTELVYEDGNLSVNSDQKLQVNELSEVFGTIIIDTSNSDNNLLESYKEMLDNEKNGIVFLKSKILIKNEMLSAITEIGYDDLLKDYNITSLDKQQILNYFYTNQIQMYVSAFAIIYIYMFIIYIASILVDVLVLATLGFVVARIIGMRVRFGASFEMAIHALTLPIILNVIYVIINGLTGYTVKYFQVMYTAISYIYIITVMFMIKSDYIKRRMEVEKIQSEQQRVRAELEYQKQKEEEEKEKQKEEKEKQEQKDKERKEQNKGKGKSSDNSSGVGKNPEGSQA